MTLLVDQINGWYLGWVPVDYHWKLLEYRDTSCALPL